MPQQLDRREFLKASMLVGTAALVNATDMTARGATTFNSPGKMRGVNLGGWLVLEKWIKPSLYAGVEAEDEFTLCEKLGKSKATDWLKQHRETWITADDFRWLAAHGLNSVRLPVGYGILEENPPFITGRETLEWAFRAARDNGLGVLLDLHGVPGSQNGWDHSGRKGALGWHTSKENIEHSLRIVEGLAEFCKSWDNLLGIELVNEPHWDVPMDILRSFYQEGYQRVRKHLSSERSAVVVHDGFRPGEWAGFMQPPAYRNVILDTHLYQCFSEADRQRSLQEQVDLAMSQRKRELDAMRKSHRCIVGEWSCSLPAEATRGTNGVVAEAGIHAFAAAQLLSYEMADGWLFWTYRTESSKAWNFRHCVERGWLPDKYDV